MNSKNPYIKDAEYKLPQTKYEIYFESLNKTIEVDPQQIPYSGTGLPGSILDIALANGIEIDHACGGVVACSTCHIKVTSGLKSCNEGLDEEFDMLDNAPGLAITSRLACQCVPDGTQKIVVEIPKWNRNMAREDH